jgi:hypothetical protein
VSSGLNVQGTYYYKVKTFEDLKIEEYFSGMIGSGPIRQRSFRTEIKNKREESGVTALPLLGPGSKL